MTSQIRKQGGHSSQCWLASNAMIRLKQRYTYSLWIVDSYEVNNLVTCACIIWNLVLNFCWNNCWKNKEQITSSVTEIQITKSKNGCCVWVESRTRSLSLRRFASWMPRRLRDKSAQNSPPLLGLLYTEENREQNTRSIYCSNSGKYF